MNTIEERVGVLLRLLGEDVATSVLDHVDTKHAKALREQISANNRMNSSDVNDVLEEFGRFLRLNDSFPEPEPEETDETEDGDAEAGEGDESPNARPALFVPSKDAAADLERLEAFQIAGALQGEQAQTIAIILKRLEPYKAAQTLGMLPVDIRPEVILLMNRESESSAVLIDQILRTIVARGLVIDSNPADAVDQDQRMADLLRSLDRKERGRILERLQESEPEFAERIQKLLFTFEDMGRMDGRSMQKLLATIETASLSKCLAAATPELVARVLDNMAKRARAALEEELEFMGKIPEEEMTLARDTISGAIMALDIAGDLDFEE